jgi:hypothetical protein
VRRRPGEGLAAGAAAAAMSSPAAAAPSSPSLASPGASPSGAHFPVGGLPDHLALLGEDPEARDAASLGLPVSRAREELRLLMDKVMLRWRKLGRYDATDVLAFLRATQAAACSHGAAGLVEVGAAYRRETERVMAGVHIRVVEQRIEELGKQQAAAQERLAQLKADAPATPAAAPVTPAASARGKSAATPAAAGSGAAGGNPKAAAEKAELLRSIAALDIKLQEARSWLVSAREVYREKFAGEAPGSPAHAGGGSAGSPRGGSVAGGGSPRDTMSDWR